MIIPAIDLMDGKCVRLKRGDFDARSDYDADPVSQAKSYAAAGARLIHIVDLDGAKSGTPQQSALISDIVRGSGVSVQTGGGIRTEQHLKALLDAGVTRVVIGSLSVTQPETVLAWLETYGANKIVLALDVHLQDGVPVPALKGWQETSDTTLWSVLETYAGKARHLLVTDIARDGMLEGINTDLYKDISQRFPGFKLQASGGVASLADITAGRDNGTSAVIIGKALYENRFTVEEAVSCWRSE